MQVVVQNQNIFDNHSVLIKLVHALTIKLTES